MLRVLWGLELGRWEHVHVAFSAVRPHSRCRCSRIPDETRGLLEREKRERTGCCRIHDLVVLERVEVVLDVDRWTLLEWAGAEERIGGRWRLSRDRENERI